MITLKQYNNEPRDWRSVAASTVVHLIAVLILFSLPVSVTRSIVQPGPSTIRLMLPRLDTPLVATRPKPAAPLLPRTFAPPEPKQRLLSKQSIEVPAPPLAKLEPVITREAPRVEALPKPQPPSPAPTARPQVVTGVLAAVVTEQVRNLPPKRVQEGGFGDPIGTRAASGAPSKMPLPSVGAFDLPAGAGQGSGLGGAKGEPGLVAASGFGSVVVPDRRRESRTVRSGGFDEATVSSEAPTAKREVRASTFGDALPPARVVKPIVTASPATPVEILYKPKPVYTNEARVAGLQGEVWLKVLFGADRTLKVLGITRNLGLGLDEAALRAAQQIRFNPAARDGEPVDSTATVRIVFLLAE